MFESWWVWTKRVVDAKKNAYNTNRNKPIALSTLFMQAAKIRKYQQTHAGEPAI